MSTPEVMILAALGLVCLAITGTVALARHHNRPPTM